MRGVVVHAPKDLRIEEVPQQSLGPTDVRVRIAAGGICGSDLHYFNHGGTGAIRIREPMVLGHEVSGTVAEIGSGVTRVAVGARVAVNPSRACGRCVRCQQGLHNHCFDMRFIGSAMRFPHIQGGFRENLVVHETQAVPVADQVGMGEAAMAEPLAVCLHAVERAGPLSGRRVLVTGCGPIGALVIMAARLAGAATVVATDVQDFALAAAVMAGADEAFNTAMAPDALDRFVAQAGPFDVLFEASGNALALRAAILHLHPRGIVVQLGLGGDIPLPINILVTREIDLRGTFRFDTEFDLAVALMNTGRINVRPLLSATLPFEDAEAAFGLAGDRSRAVKVQLSFV
ncbi:L-idonate 5-dehydrogenase [Lichenifustis flavocetrariae]|uniref:L-idonate 5-dehydrogenase n=1 Tax=Lichenifustis flavocetrariae TaxID=2949735 RepID=A0AA42CLT6_9HYPH|nr:L-idonate 5-dehydrogenase [Lichenifustis flavocetrariae]MCW6510786.1 L-idonate 5-dehydrogenase [Lichenifustis flavocetrariae]